MIPKTIRFCLLTHRTLVLLLQPQLNLSPLPDPSTLALLIQEILTPVFPDLAADAQLSAEGVRDVPGLGQVLVDRSG